MCYDERNSPHTFDLTLLILNTSGSTHTCRAFNQNKQVIISNSSEIYLQVLQLMYYMGHSVFTTEEESPNFTFSEHGL